MANGSSASWQTESCVDTCTANLSQSAGAPGAFPHYMARVDTSRSNVETAARVLFTHSRRTYPGEIYWIIYDAGGAQCRRLLLIRPCTSSRERLT